MVRVLLIGGLLIPWFPTSVCLLLGFIMATSEEVKEPIMDDQVRQVHSMDDSVRQITYMKLNGSNYNSWSREIEEFL